MQLIKLLITSLLFCVSTAAIAQGKVFYPSDSLILEDKFEYRMDRLDSMIAVVSSPDSLQVLESKAARLYWGTGSARIVLPDTSNVQGYCNRYDAATHHYFYLDMNGEKIPDALMCNSLAYQYYLFDNGNFSALPNLPANNRLRYVYMRYSADVPALMPKNWGMYGDHIQRLYFQRCSYTTAQVDALIVQLEQLVNEGLGTGITGIHYLYLNTTGTNQNEAPTTDTHIANGWATNSGYLSKTIKSVVWRVYHN